MEDMTKLFSAGTVALIVSVVSAVTSIGSYFYLRARAPRHFRMNAETGKFSITVNGTNVSVDDKALSKLDDNTLANLHELADQVEQERRQRRAKK
jgi:hypothetical protein